MTASAFSSIDIEILQFEFNQESQGTERVGTVVFARLRVQRLARQERQQVTQGRAQVSVPLLGLDAAPVVGLYFWRRASGPGPWRGACGHEAVVPVV